MPKELVALTKPLKNYKGLESNRRRKHNHPMHDDSSDGNIKPKQKQQQVTFEVLFSLQKGNNCTLI